MRHVGLLLALTSEIGREIRNDRIERVRGSIAQAHGEVLKALCNDTLIEPVGY